MPPSDGLGVVVDASVFHESLLVGGLGKQFFSRLFFCEVFVVCPRHVCKLSEAVGMSIYVSVSSYAVGIVVVHKLKFYPLCLLLHIFYVFSKASSGGCSQGRNSIISQPSCDMGMGRTSH